MQLKTKMSLPELALIAGTRVLAGAGVGLLLAGRFDDRTRKVLGWTLFGIGAASTLPLALEVFSDSDEHVTLSRGRDGTQSRPEMRAH